MANPIADPFVEVPDTDTQSGLVRIEGGAGGAVTVVINRAEKKNALNPELIAALRETFETLHAADGVRVVFIKGEGDDFSAGADRDCTRGAKDLTEADSRDDAMQLASMLKHLHDLPCLTVALVDGVALDAGAGLAAACDMAIATKNARFAFSDVKFGLIPGAVSPYVVAAVGARRARALFARGSNLGADAAREIGLIDEVVENAQALAAVQDRLAVEMMTCAPGAMADAKRLVAVVAGRQIDHSLMEDTARLSAQACVGDEGREGVDALLTRRKPGWAL